MKHELFTETERQVLALYRSPSNAMGNATRLSVQYLIGAGLFVAAAFIYQEPLYALASYGVFVLFVFLRLAGARRSSTVMPTILSKYEARVRELEKLTADSDDGT